MEFDKEDKSMFSETQQLLLFLLVVVLVIPMFISIVNWRNVKYLIRGQVMLIARNVYFKLR